MLYFSNCSCLSANGFLPYFFFSFIPAFQRFCDSKIFCVIIFHLEKYSSNYHVINILKRSNLRISERNRHIIFNIPFQIVEIANSFPKFCITLLKYCRSSELTRLKTSTKTVTLDFSYKDSHENKKRKEGMKIEKNDKQLSCQNFLLLLTKPTQLNTRFVYSLNDAINQDVSIVPNFQLK